MLSTGPEIKVTSGDIIRCFTDIRHYPGAPPHTRPPPPGRPWLPAPASPARWAPWWPGSPSWASFAWNKNHNQSHYREEGLPVSLRVSISCQKIYDRQKMFLICWCQPLPCVLAGCCSVCPHHYLCHNLAQPQQHLDSPYIGIAILLCFVFSVVFSGRGEDSAIKARSVCYIIKKVDLFKLCMFYEKNNNTILIQMLFHTYFAFKMFLECHFWFSSLRF